MNKKFLSFMVAMMLMVLMTFNTVADDGAREIVFSGKEAGVLLIGANYDGSYDGDYSFSTVEELINLISVVDSQPDIKDIRIIMTASTLEVTDTITIPTGLNVSIGIADDGSDHLLRRSPSLATDKPMFNHNH